MNKVNHFLSFSGIIVLMACLFTTNAQQTSVYDNFDASSVKSNEKYTWNYKTTTKSPFATHILHYLTI